MSKGSEKAMDRGLLPEGAGPPRVIACERSGRWAAALRRELVEVYETRGLAECWEMLARWPASFLVVELPEHDVAPLVDYLAMLEREFPLARAAVVADRRRQAYQWLLREAGAVHFVTSPRELATLAQAIRRHLERAPTPQLSLAQQVWAELPWGRRE